LSIGVTGEYIQSLIDEVREDIGRIVTFYVPNPQPTYTDLYNPITDTRSKVTYTTHEILARVHWTSDEAITASPGGKYYIGQCYIHINPDYLEIAKSTQVDGGKVVVDGNDMTISKIIPQGVITINRYRLILEAFGDKK
jgi:hypothetical protein